MANIIRKLLQSSCCLFTFVVHACPVGTVEVIVFNTSRHVLKLDTWDEHTCKLTYVTNVRPGIKGKYCIRHDYLLQVTTLSLKGGTRLAITATDVWDNLVITTPKKTLPDIKFHHLHNDIKHKHAPKVITKEEGTISQDDYKDLEEADFTTAKPSSTKNTKKPNEKFKSLLD